MIGVIAEAVNLTELCRFTRAGRNWWQNTHIAKDSTVNTDLRQGVLYLLPWQLITVNKEQHRGQTSSNILLLIHNGGLPVTLGRYRSMITSTVYRPLWHSTNTRMCFIRIFLIHLDKNQLWNKTKNIKLIKLWCWHFISKNLVAFHLEFSICEHWQLTTYSSAKLRERSTATNADRDNCLTRVFGRPNDECIDVEPLAFGPV